MVHWHKDSNEVMFLKDLKRHTKDVKIDTIIYILKIHDINFISKKSKTMGCFVTCKNHSIQSELGCQVRKTMEQCCILSNLLG